MHKKITILVIIAILFVQTGLSQFTDSSYSVLKQAYDNRLAITNGNLKSLLSDSAFIKSFNNDSLSFILHYINKFNEKKYLAILDIEDSSTAKQLMQEEIKNLVDINHLFQPAENKITDQIMVIRSSFNEIYWLMKNKPEGLGLEDCGECFFSRPIVVYVIKKQNNKLYTMPCSQVKYYKKVPFAAREATSISFDSYPCQEARRKISTGKNHIFLVTLDGKQYEQIKEVPPGISKNDVLMISLIILP